MAEKKIDSLEILFDDQAMFTRRGGTGDKTQELAAIRTSCDQKRWHLVWEGLRLCGGRSHSWQHRGAAGPSDQR